MTLTPLVPPVAIEDSDGNQVWKGEYYPFGEERSIQQTPDSNNRRLIGKEKDTETGLTYFDARYMDATTGRFLTPDSVRAVDEFTSGTNYVLLTAPQRLNLYAYGLNNPYRYVDSDGRIALEMAIEGAEVGFSLGGPGGSLAGGAIGLGLGLWGGQQIWDHIFAEESNNNSGAAKKGPRPNEGIAKPHGGSAHDKAINDRIEEVKKIGAKNVRKNQQQVDVDGNKLDTNRPDLQYDLNGVHCCEEWDTKVESGYEHKERIERNDPNAE